MFKLLISTSNASFDDDAVGAIVDVLEGVKAQLLTAYSTYPHLTETGEFKSIKDTNGNTIGFWSNAPIL